MVKEKMGKNAAEAKTYDGQTAKLGAVLLVNMPPLTDVEMQRLIENPKTVQEALFKAFCSRVIQIDRSVPFDPVKLLGQGWTIEEQDECSLALTQIDLANVKLESMLKKDESWIKGEEKLKRLKQAGYIPLDTKVFQTLLENKVLIPESWKEKTNGNTTYIFFDGTVLRGPGGHRCVLYLCWSDGRWRWGCDWLGGDWYVSDPSAVLASK